MNIIDLTFLKRKHKYLFYLVNLVSFTLLLYGCTSSPPMLRVSKNSTTAPNVIHPVYNDIWSALESLQTDMEALQQFSPDNEINQFCKGLKYIRELKNDEAEVIFRALGDTAEKKLIKDHSRKIYSNLLFNAGKFQELYKYSKDHPAEDSIKNQSQSLINAFSQIPSEIYQYPEIPIKVPLSVSKIGTPIIQVKVNGKLFNFWIDSGAELSVLSSDIADIGKVQPLIEETTSAETATNIRVTAQPAIIDSIDIGGLIIRNHPIIIIDKSDLEFKLFGLFTMVKIDGIIGWNAIRNMRLEIDYAFREVTITKPKLTENEKRNFFWLGYPIVELISDGGIPVLFGLDLGARSSSITNHIFQRINVLPSDTKQENVGSAGGFEKLEIKVLPELTLLFDNYRLQFNNIQTRPAKGAIFIKPDGILGADIVENAKLIIDYQNGYFGYEVVR